MTQVPPEQPAQHAQLPVGIPLIPIAQQWHLAPGEIQTPEGTVKVVYVTFVQPLTALTVIFAAEAWNALCDQMRQHFTGLEVARDLPGTNGHGQMPPGFQL